MRETKKVTTPSGKEVELKTYITARERNQLRNVLLEKAEVDNAGKVSSNLSGATLEKSQYTTIELVVVSYDGSTETILDRILDGSPADYDFIVDEASKVGNLAPAK